ncbi:O-antigen ligase family protein [Calothrix sp. UHCC 0171]|uniref:O-antigen ligase family protein n=1 Tax=Calothrix sp. UHCC 0171 TaxID=3110245 RepID=UPI002B20135E|nr:O-antigen ligase family protein [Calothrix sp. UHCC 0171]MEA5571823.1 O-antigen ligase family protein [Calothrix sp. UHCC 0171]
MGWIIPYIILTIPVLIIRKKGEYPPISILWWCLGFFLLAFFSYSFFPPSESSLRIFIDRSSSTLFLLVTTFLFADRRIQNWTKYVLMSAIGMGVFNNLYHIANPSAFGGLVEGRAVGFYLDPNDCANALILGMILTVEMLPKKLRFLWVVIVGLGVISTFSRGGILAWVVVVMMMSITRIVSLQKSLLWVVGIGLILFFATQLGSIGDSVNIHNQLDSIALQRVESMIDGGDVVEDESTIERKAVAEKGWEMFLERPIFGYGIGSTFDYSITKFSVSTHNMFLLYAAEYGIVGILILPLATYAVTHRARGETRKIGIIFTIFILFVSLFSHTVLSLLYYLIPFALMAVMSESSRQICSQQALNNFKKDQTAIPTNRVVRG